MGKSSALETVVISSDLEHRLRALASELGESPSGLALLAIEEFVSDLEDVRAARERLADLRHGRSDAVALEELMSRHGMAD